MQVKTGSGNKGLDWVFILGAIAAYPKTADLLSLFSPQILNDIFGMDMSLPYGGFCALLVEGVILFLHFDRRAYYVPMAQAVKWIMFGISFLCNVFDGFVTTNSVQQMSPFLKFILAYGVPTLPLIIAALVAMIGPLPEDGQSVSQPNIGMKTRLNNFWHGENTRVSPKVVRQIEEILEPEQEEQNVNPTNGKRS
jgi:hypothetical protein